MDKTKIADELLKSAGFAGEPDAQAAGVCVEATEAAARECVGSPCTWPACSCAPKAVTPVTVLEPVVGGPVLFYPARSGDADAAPPVHGRIVHVWGPGCVNLETEAGALHSSVVVVEPGSTNAPSGYYCRLLVDLAPIKAGDVITITPDPESVLGRAIAASAGGTKPVIELPPQEPEAPRRILPLYRLDQAQALPEVEDGLALHHSDDEREILAFKDVDGRTMRVVLTDTGLAKRAA